MVGVPHSPDILKHKTFALSTTKKKSCWIQISTMHVLRVQPYLFHISKLFIRSLNVLYYSSHPQSSICIHIYLSHKQPHIYVYKTQSAQILVAFVIFLHQFKLNFKCCPSYPSNFKSVPLQIHIILRVTPNIKWF